MIILNQSDPFRRRRRAIAQIIPAPVIVNKSIQLWWTFDSSWWRVEGHTEARAAIGNALVQVRGQIILVMVIQAVSWVLHLAVTYVQVKRRQFMERASIFLQNIPWHGQIYRSPVRHLYLRSRLLSQTFSLAFEQIWGGASCLTNTSADTTCTIVVNTLIADISQIFLPLKVL